MSVAQLRRDPRTTPSHRTYDDDDDDDDLKKITPFPVGRALNKLFNRVGTFIW